MKNIADIFLATILALLIVSWTFIFIVGTGEILYWIFTGNFFHLMATNTSTF